MTRAVALAILGLAAASTAGGEEAASRLVRFTSERLALPSGGNLTPDRFAVLTAQVAPQLEGVEISFEIVAGSGAGRAVPAMLSRTRVATRPDGVARTVLLTSDAEETCRVSAHIGGTAPLYLTFEFRRTVQDGIVVASPSAWTTAPVGAVDERLAVLAARLADPAVEVRTAAKRMLLALSSEAVGALVAVAGSAATPRDARDLAVRTLAEMRDGEADDQLLALVGHPLPGVRLGAEKAIARMDLERAEDLGAKALSSHDELVRAAGVRIVAALGSESAERAAFTALSDASPMVRGTVAWELARAQAASAAPAIMTALADETEFVRTLGAKAVVILGRLYVDEPRPLATALARLLNDPSPAARGAAARALGVLEAGPESALPGVFADRDVRVRRSAALAIPWRADHRSNVRMLRALLDDADEVVRTTAMHAVAGSGGPAEVDLLVGILDAGDGALRDRAIRALRRVTCVDFGWTRARTDDERDAVVAHWRTWFASNRTTSRDAWLRQALDLPGSTLRGLAGLELARSQPLKPTGPGEVRERESLRAALRQIVGATREADAAAERHAACEGLLVLADESGLNALKPSLADAKRYVRISAVRALAGAARSGAAVASEEVGLAVYGALVDALEDESVTVRRVAVRGLQDVSRESFGFLPRAPKAHRARAAAAWRAWLEKRTAATRPVE